jgi:hypothetical protein
VVVGQHHAVHAADDRSVEAEVWVGSGLKHVSEGVPVSPDLGEGDLVGGQRLFVVKRCDCIVFGDDVAFDAVGSADGAREHGATQSAFPTLGDAEHCGEVLPHGVDLVEDGRVVDGERWRGIDQESVTRCPHHRDNLARG